MWRRWGIPQTFLLLFTDELWENWKIQILKKWKKIAGDIPILHICTKNHNDMRYSAWDTEWDRIFGHFGPFFALLPKNILILSKYILVELSTSVYQFSTNPPSQHKK